jgi:colanic acid biosynthesis glycosyl transferase WcaI
MRVGVVGLNFYPERVGIGVYTHDMCRFFVEAGHDVSVITGFPFYPELRPHLRYAGRLFVTERVDGMTVHRCFVHVPSRWSVSGRIAHEISFALSTFPRLLRLRADVLVAVSPAFVPAVGAAVVAHARRIPLAVHIQDLQPDAAAKLGMVRNRLILNALYRAEDRLYRSATLISALDETMCTTIERKGVPQTKVVVFPNWVDLDLGAPLDRGHAFRKDHGFEDRFLVVYSGSMGVKQGLDLILDVAVLALGEAAIHFVLIGDGAAREGLERVAGDRGLTNVVFLPSQPLERFRAVIAASDLSLIPQRPEVRDLVVPSKVLRLLAGGSPIIAATHPESGLAQLLRQSGAGVVVPGHDPAAVWELIRELKANPERRRVMADRGRAFAAERFGRHAVLGRYLERLEVIAGRRAAVPEPDRAQMGAPAR